METSRLIEPRGTHTPPLLQPLEVLKWALQIAQVLKITTTRLGIRVQIMRPSTMLIHRMNRTDCGKGQQLRTNAAETIPNTQVIWYRLLIITS